MVWRGIKVSNGKRYRLRSGKGSPIARPRHAQAPASTTAPLIPPEPSISILEEAAAGCRACDLWKSSGVWISSAFAPFVMATGQPSSLLRAPDEETRHNEMKRFIADLGLVRSVLEKPAA